MIFSLWTLSLCDHMYISRGCRPRSGNKKRRLIWRRLRRLQISLSLLLILSTVYCKSVTVLINIDTRRRRVNLLILEDFNSYSSLLSRSLFRGNLLPSIFNNTLCVAVYVHIQCYLAQCRFVFNQTEKLLEYVWNYYLEVNYRDL